MADAALDAISALLVENARLVRTSSERARGELDGAHRDLERAHLRPTYRWREKTVRRLQRQSGRAIGAAGLPAGARQELAVGVAPDPPGREAVGARADDAADDRDPAADRGRQPLAGDPGDQVGGDDRRR